VAEIGPVVQSDRASDFGCEGWGFKSPGVAIPGQQWQMVTSNLGVWQYHRPFCEACCWPYILGAMPPWHRLRHGPGSGRFEYRP
jgi:hypothetical protein